MVFFNADYVFDYGKYPATLIDKGSKYRTKIYFDHPGIKSVVVSGVTRHIENLQAQMIQSSGNGDADK